MTNLVIGFTNIVFAATLETAPSVTGQWMEVLRVVSPCPEAKSFSVLPKETSAFFRLRLHDNGILPTPGTPKAYFVGELVSLISQQPVYCDGPISYRWFRDGAVIGTSEDGTFTDSPPAGFHLYQVQAFSDIGESWLTDYVALFVLG